MRSTIHATAALFGVAFVLALILNLLSLCLPAGADTTVPVPDDVFIEQAKRELHEDFSKATKLKGEIITQMDTVLNHLMQLRENGDLASDAQFEATYARALKNLDDRVTALLQVRVRIDENLHLISRALVYKQRDLKTAIHKIDQKRGNRHMEAIRLRSRARRIARQYQAETDPTKKRLLAREFLSVRRAETFYRKWDRVYQTAVEQVNRVAAAYGKLPESIENLRFALQDQFLNLSLAHGFLRDAADLQRIVVGTKLLLAKGIVGADGLGAFVKEVSELRTMVEGIEKVSAVDPSFDAFTRELTGLTKLVEFDDGLTDLGNPEGLSQVEAQMLEILREDEAIPQNSQRSARSGG